MAKYSDLTGKKFNRLTVIKKADDYISPKGQHQIQWLCICECGNEIITTGNRLKRGHTKSCGCWNKERTSETHKKYNTYNLTGEYGIGYTSKGEEFYFDLEDYDKIKDFYWYRDKEGYVINKTNNSDKLILLHRLLVPNYEIVDHINHVTYDNRKINLRGCTVKENTRNQKLRIDNTSGVTGVRWDKIHKKWIAYIYVDKKRISLGYYNVFEEAVGARKRAENKYFGEFSYDNSINKEKLKYG